MDVEGHEAVRDQVGAGVGHDRLERVRARGAESHRIQDRVRPVGEALVGREERDGHRVAGDAAESQHPLERGYAAAADEDAEPLTRAQSVPAVVPGITRTGQGHLRTTSVETDPAARGRARTPEPRAEDEEVGSRAASSSRTSAGRGASPTAATAMTRSRAAKGLRKPGRVAQDGDGLLGPVVGHGDRPDVRRVAAGEPARGYRDRAGRVVQEALADVPGLGRPAIACGRPHHKQVGAQLGGEVLKAVNGHVADHDLWAATHERGHLAEIGDRAAVRVIGLAPRDRPVRPPGR